MDLETSDFFIESMGHCFICLKQSDKTSLLSPAKPSSFQLISHYLKLDKKKAFQADVPIPQHLLILVEKSKLTVELCEACEKINVEFATLYNELNKIKIELMRWLQNVQGILEKGNKLGRTEKLVELTKDNGMSLEKINIFKRIRMETLQKCKLKLNQSMQPEIRISKLTPSVLKQYVKKEPIHDEMEGSDPDPFLQQPDDDRLHSSTSLVSSPGQSRIESKKKTRAKGKQSMGKSVQEGRYSCKICENKRFRQKTRLKDHMQLFHGQGTSKYKCPGCLKPFRDAYDLKVHLRNKICSDDNKLQEFLADLENGRKDSQKLNSVEDDDPLKRKPLYPRPTIKCNLCHKYYRGRSTLRRHIETVHEKARFQCDVCPKSYSRQVYLDAHKQDRHLGGHKHKCEHCQKTFRDAYELRRHKSRTDFYVNVQKRTLACDLCCKSYGRPDQLEKHKLRAHFSIAKTFKCEICHKIFQTEYGYNLHKEKKYCITNKSKRGGITVKEELDNETAGEEDTQEHCFSLNEGEEKLDSKPIVLMKIDIDN